MTFQDVQNAVRDFVIAQDSGVESVLYYELGAGPGVTLRAFLSEGGLEAWDAADGEGLARVRTVRLSAAAPVTVTEGKDKLDAVPEEGGAPISYVVSKLKSKNATWMILEVTR